MNLKLQTARRGEKLSTLWGCKRNDQMPFSFLYKLSGSEVKVFMAIMVYSDKKHEFENMERLTDFNLAYPTVVNTVQELEKRGCIKKFDTGGKLILRVAGAYQAVAAHIKKCPTQLEFLPDGSGDSKEDHKPSAKWWTKKDQDDLIRHYAQERGVPDESLRTWYRSDYKKNIQAAQFILDYCSNIDQAKQSITNCRIDRTKQKLEWSLAGDVRRNIQDYVPKSTGAKKWH